MNDTDLISVIIPTYNRAHIIKRSVESVLNQTYKNLELIIVDDGSTDNTKDVIKSLEDERIIYFYQTNQGVSAARNKGIEAAKGKYIAFNDSDDVWHLEKLEKQINTLKQNNADICFCKVFHFGKLLKRVSPKFKEGFLSKEKIPLNIFPQTLLGKSEIFKNNFFDKRINGIEDFELLLRIQKKYTLYCLNKPLVDYYVQQDSISSNHERRIQDLKIILSKNKTISTDYSPYYLNILAQAFLYSAFDIKDLKKRNDALDCIFKISKSKRTIINYYLHKFHIYKLKALMYRTAASSIKKILKILNL